MWEIRTYTGWVTVNDWFSKAPCSARVKDREWGSLSLNLLKVQFSWLLFVYFLRDVRDYQQSSFILPNNARLFERNYCSTLIMRDDAHSMVQLTSETFDTWLQTNPLELHQRILPSPKVRCGSGKRDIRSIHFWRRRRAIFVCLKTVSFLSFEDGESKRHQRSFNEMGATDRKVRASAPAFEHAFPDHVIPRFEHPPWPHPIVPCVIFICGDYWNHVSTLGNPTHLQNWRPRYVKISKQ